jgi:hypothetical protein
MTEFRFEGSKATFDFSSMGLVTNESFSGEFAVKCAISPIDHLKSDRLYRELIGEVNPHLASQEAQNYAFALSQLKQRVIESPHFFKNKEIDGGHLDSNVLVEIVNIAIEAEAKYREQQNERMEKVQETLTKRIQDGQIKKEEEVNEEEIVSHEETVTEINLEE